MYHARGYYGVARSTLRNTKVWELGRVKWLKSLSGDLFRAPLPRTTAPCFRNSHIFDSPLHD